MSGNLPIGEPPRRSVRPGFAAAVLFLVLVLAGGIFVATRHGDASAPQPPALGTELASSGPAASGAALGAQSPPSGCHPSDTDAGVPQAAPAGIAWSLFDTVALPSSPSAGPLQVRGDVAACYAHTPTGALIAAAQISTRALLAEDWRAVVAAGVVADGGARAYAADRARVSVGPATAGDFGQIAAFQFASYTSGQASIQLVARFPNGALQAVTYTVRWSGGDWKLQLLPNGAMSANAQVLPNLIGFIPFGGV